jgi:AcrR family transcriptional regulator
MTANQSVTEPHRLTPKGRATRERIVVAAAQLMYDHGVAGTSLGDVQKAAGVGPSQVYHYFGDKESLIRAVIAHRLDAPRRRPSARARAAGAAPPSAVIRRRCLHVICSPGVLVG